MNKLLLLSGLAVLSLCIQAKTAQADASDHIANSGAVFTLDHSNPRLGTAYRDENGLVWGGAQAGLRRSQMGAAAYCKSLRARLPSIAEFQELARLLGNNSAAGYSVSSADVVTPVLPNFISGYFWSSDYSEGYSTGSEFSSDDGYTGVTSPGNADSVICISL